MTRFLAVHTVHIIWRLKIYQFSGCQTCGEIISWHIEFLAHHRVVDMHVAPVSFPIDRWTPEQAYSYSGRHLCYYAVLRSRTTTVYKHG